MREEVSVWGSVPQLLSPWLASEVPLGMTLRAYTCLPGVGMRESPCLGTCNVVKPT